MTRTKVELNAQQLKAVNHVWGPCFISACPGSGKTSVIVERCARLIEQGFDSKKILCITFTNKASNEMRNRLKSMVGEPADGVYISTFHALCANILRKFGKHIGYDKDMMIVASDDQESFMSQCSRHLSYEIEKGEVRNILWKCNDARENLIGPDDSEFGSYFDSSHHSKIAREYIHSLRESNRTDFSGLLFETIRLFEKDREVLCKLQDRFDFIQVDEAQDCNKIQHTIASKLGEDGNILMVGDLDQSIFSWRGAHPLSINNFIDNFGAEIIRLPINYRSSKNIVKTADKLIRHNENRQEVEFETVNADGRDVDCFYFDSPDQEGRWIGKAIQQLSGKEGIKLHDCAILYRTNAMSRAVETGLVNYGIDYQVFGAFGFFDRMEIKDCLAMIKFLVNPKDSISLSRFVNKPSRKIGAGTLAKIEKFSAAKKISILAAMNRGGEYIKGANSITINKSLKEMYKLFSKDFSGMKIGDIMEALFTGMNYLEYLKNNDEDSMQNRADNLQELFTSASNFNGDLTAYLNKIALQSGSDKDTVDDSVSLMTIHSAKGLEFPVVFLIGMDEGTLPHAMSLKENDGCADEERRLAYVGMTRAKNHLITTFPTNRPKRSRNSGVYNVPTKPSRFLKEAGLLDNAKRLQA